MLDPNAKAIALAMLVAPTMAQHGRVTPSELCKAIGILESIEEFVVLGTMPSDPPAQGTRAVPMPHSLSTVLPSPDAAGFRAPAAPSFPSHPSDAAGNAVTTSPVARVDASPPSEMPPQLRRIISPQGQPSDDEPTVT